MEEAKNRWPILLDKFISGTITPDELMEFERLRFTSSEKQQQYLDITDPEHFSKRLREFENVDTQKAWASIEASLYAKDEEVSSLKPGKFWTPYLLWAAAAIVIIVLAVSFPFPSYTVPRVKDHSYTKLTGTEYRLDPGKKFNALKSGLFLNYINSFISFNNSLSNQEVIQKNKHAVEIVTSYGKQLTIKLPDNSLVKLNTASAISFRLDFNETERRVELFGEAYFEVAQDPKRPFIVSAKKYEIKAIGTTFNVTSYENEDIKVTLLNGEIRIENGNKEFRLTGAKEAALTEGGNIAISDQVNIDKSTAWTRNEFYFKNATIEEIVSELARWYNVEVSFQGRISKARYDVRFLRSSNLSEILGVLNTQSETQIIQRGRRLIVTNDVSKKRPFQFLNQILNP